MISCFLQIPLRYPVMHKGSRSSIKDTITDRLSEKEREFPLYSRGERFHFEYGVYLLNKNIAQLRYQHGLTTPDLQQTLPNLKNFLEHGLMVRCDRHSGSIPVPAKSRAGLPATPDTGYSCHTGLPDQDIRRKVSSGEESTRYQPAPPPSYETIMDEEPPPASLTVPSSQYSSSSLERMASGTLAGRTDARDEVNVKDKTEVVDLKTPQSQEQEELQSAGQPAPSADESNSSSVPDAGLADGPHGGVMNGSLVSGLESVVPEVHCPVEQAEEIMGTEATSLGLGFGIGLRLPDEAQLEDYRCIPVDHAVAVECDEQVLGELDVAGLEEFSRRIYALNENMSSFRRPRKGSDK
ncbi:hypothetical protein fugu_008704 [Takifugu bimaculatus]|uniref:UV radiation resistance-associated gene protein n=1 Tax=Takifugu bimaculatus TaxID=433685 RepID=A0A4Z2AYI3_9TELE|nr:hypothetical protein fugu_008704 [Takifugu bimaculatus]